jgi:hypothetical protein
MGLRPIGKEQEPVFMIWVDEAGGGQFAGTTDVSPERGQRFDGSVAGVPFTCLIPEQKPGTLKLGTDSFQLEQGGLFLISKSGSSLRIKQMSLAKLNLPTGKNFSASKLTNEYFRSLAKTDPDIQAFWNESSSPK